VLVVLVDDFLEVDLAGVGGEELEAVVVG